MAKKTAAQLKRLMKRAETRGEVYIPPNPPPLSLSDKIDDSNHARESSPLVDEPGERTLSIDQPIVPQSLNDASSNASNDQTNLVAVLQLKNDLAAIESNAELKAKERRSAKRKVEAIAVESCNCSSVEELLQWYETVGKKLEDKQRSISETEENEKKILSASNKKTIPYILFIGQLSYDTTKEGLFQHIRKQLENDHTVTEKNLKIRMLHDVETKKSRGMAFVEVQSDEPELMYSCLKLHRTFLNGRRLNVERSAGGGVQTRKMKIQQHRAEQEQYIDTTVNNMLQEYYQRGEIQPTGEIDDGVIQLCKRHSTTVVQASLERYVESNGRDMDNPSAYLSFLLTKLAEEGIYNNRDVDKTDQKGTRMKKPTSKKHSNERVKDKYPSNDQGSSQAKKKQKLVTGAFKNSEFAKQGVDMSVSETNDKLLTIFPSLSRGRGRGRGYM
jgi:RNA recognition motif-containing protein